MIIGMPDTNHVNPDSQIEIDDTSPDWDSPESLDICVIGAGAVGGLIGGHMAQRGANVTLIDKGPHLDALQDTGLTLLSRNGDRNVIDTIESTEHVTTDRPVDLVVLGVKAYDLEEIAPMIPQLTGPTTTILPVQNGIPWWYFQQYRGKFDGYRIDAIDSDGRLERYIPAERIVGCVPFVASTIVEPGTVKHTEGEWFPVGELHGRQTNRVQGIANLFEDVGLRSRVLEDIRSEVWLKGLGNLAFNPMSVLTRATLGEMCRNPGTRAVARAMMEEAKVVAEACGAEFRRTIEERIDGAERVGDHNTSMLQDFDRGNKLETEALVGSVIELASLTDHDVPTIETVYALVNLLEDTTQP